MRRATARTLINIKNKHSNARCRIETYQNKRLFKISKLSKQMMFQIFVTVEPRVKDQNKDQNGLDHNSLGSLNVEFRILNLAFLKVQIVVALDH